MTAYLLQGLDGSEPLVGPWRGGVGAAACAYALSVSEPCSSPRLYLPLFPCVCRVCTAAHRRGVPCAAALLSECGQPFCGCRQSIHCQVQRVALVLLKGMGALLWCPIPLLSCVWLLAARMTTEWWWLSCCSKCSLIRIGPAGVPCVLVPLLVAALLGLCASCARVLLPSVRSLLLCSCCSIAQLPGGFWTGCSTGGRPIFLLATAVSDTAWSLKSCAALPAQQGYCTCRRLMCRGASPSNNQGSVPTDPHVA